MKHLLKISLLIFFLVVLLLFPAPIIEAVKLGLLTCVEKVIPALFPFFVLTRLMIYFQLPQLIGKLLAPLFYRVLHLSPITFFIILMSLISGNPSGAKLAREYYDHQLITKKECEGLFYFCNFASPLFIIGTIGVVLFHSPTIGYFMLGAHFLGAILVFIGCYPYFKTTTHRTITLSFPTESFAEILIDCIENSIQTLLRVSGIIVCYYILSAILTTIQVTPFLDHLILPFIGTSIPTLEPLVAGTFEFVQGVTKLSQLSMSLPLQLALIAFCTSFAGLSVHTQTFMYAKGLSISYVKYLCFRLIHGVSSFCLVLWFYRYLPLPSDSTVTSGLFISLDQRLLKLTILILMVYVLAHLFKRIFPSLKSS